MPDDSNHAVQVLLTEYNALKAEIYGRSRDQLLCIINSLIAIGALFTAIATSGGELAILALIIPWLLTIFGIIWCDHHTTIHYIGMYIQRIENKQFINLISKNQNSLYYWGWENWFHLVKRTQKELSKRTFTILHIILPLIYFFLPSLLAVSYYVTPRISKSWFFLPFKFNLRFFPEGVIIIADIFLILIFFIFYLECCNATNFKTTKTESQFLEHLFHIHSEKNNYFISNIFKIMTGVKLDVEDINNRRKKYEKKLTSKLHKTTT